MGQVWEALDLELHEPIAIKAIRSDIAAAPGALTRFKREVYATRRVTHPNVCRTFDLESHTILGSASTEPHKKITFLTMELLRGETLAERLRRTGPLPLDQVYLLALQVGKALQAAHDVGIIHCDLKPANIFMTGSEKRPRAVVTDFGIAKVIQTHDDDETSPPIFAQGATLAGGVAGTPRYMAPEQFQGRHCTAATDIYCYGLVLYEALTAEKGSLYDRFATDRSNRLLEEKPVESADRPSLDPQWSLLLENCLKMDPRERLGHMQGVLDLLNSMASLYSTNFANATDPSGRVLSSASAAPALLPEKAGPLAVLLRKRAFLYTMAAIAIGVATLSVWYERVIATAPAASIPSVAVLPLNSVGDDPNLTTLSEGVAGALTNNLSQVSGLRVPSEIAVSGLGTAVGVRSAGQSLGVDHILAGSISKAEDEVHLQIELVDAKTELQLWGQSYTTKIADLAGIEADIAQEVAFRLQTEANRSSGNKSSRQHESVPAAQQAYQKGKEAMANRTPAGFDQAIAYFQQAIDADPQDASAIAELAQCYSLMAYNYNRPEPPLALLSQAEETARRALRADSTSAEAYTTLAEAELLKDYNWDAAEKDYRRAIELDPSYLPGHIDYAFHLLTAKGRFAEARGQYAYANRANTKSIAAQVSQALTAYYERRFADSSAQAEEIRKQAPGLWYVVEVLAANSILMGEPAEAVALLTSTPATSGDATSLRDAMLGIAYARLGKRDEALRQLEQLERAGKSSLDYTLATLSAAVGLNDKAMDYLEKAYTSKESDILFLGVDPLLDPLRGDARFQKLLSKMNLR